MGTETRPRKKMSEMRSHLTDTLVKNLPKKHKQYSIGDNEIVGLRVFVYPSGVKTYHYTYTDSNGKKQKERLESCSVIKVSQARNRAKKVAVQVMEGIAASQIRRNLATEMTVEQLFEEYEKARLKSPRYKDSTIRKWQTFRRVWINKKTTDVIIKAMFAKTKLDLGGLQLSKVNKDILIDYHKFIGDKAEDPANAVIQMMSVIFNYAVEKKYVQISPVQFKKDDFYKQRENNRYLTRQQMDAVIDYCLNYDERNKDNPKLNHDYYRSRQLDIVSCSIIAKALLDGHRYRNEGSATRWNEVSLNQKKLYFGDTKTGQQEYSIGPKALKLLTAIKNERFREGSKFWYPNDIRKDYVFPSKWFGMVNNIGKLNERPFVYTVSGTWKTCLKRLGIDYLPMYNCRHSYLTDGLRKTGNLKMMKEIAGHKKITTTERYARILGADVKEALNTIDGPEETATNKVVEFKSNK